MALAYFDSSAFVKLVVDEDGSDIASAIWDGCDAALSSRLAYPEVCAAIAAAQRNHALDKRGAAKAAASWEEFWAATRPVEFTRMVEREAGRLAVRHSLRGADAVHLASAVALDDPSVTVVAWDRRLRSAVTAAGLSPAPLSLPR